MNRSLLRDYDITYHSDRARLFMQLISEEVTALQMLDFNPVPVLKELSELCDELSSVH